MLTVNEETEKPGKLVYSIPDAAYVLGEVSQNHVRNLIRDKALEKVCIGRRVMVTADSIRRLLERGGTNSEQAAA